MISILINFFTVILLLVSVFLVLIVLAQKTKDGGMGSALGGGMTESTFGAETGNVLTKTTRKLAIAFFVLALGLYIWKHLRAQAFGQERQGPAHHRGSRIACRSRRCSPSDAGPRWRRNQEALMRV